MTAISPPGALATSDNSDELRRCSDELRRWLTDPDWPHRPRIWTRRQPLNISARRRIASLYHLLHQPYEIVTVDLTQDTITITPL